uniref:Uncharacterized protein n=1 Tax=Populus alba TaxID=43335 RepID=A0A4U5PKF0_POPAL|nr:hypothetical protein D5086_0000216380 [Populus alba]
MAKTRWKIVATVSRGKDTLHVHVPDDPNHDGSIISPFCPDVLPTIPEISSGSKLLDTVTVEDCSEDEALVKVLLEEEQLDFSFSDDDCCDVSPKSPPLLSPPTTPIPPLIASRVVHNIHLQEKKISNLNLRSGTCVLLVMFQPVGSSVAPDGWITVESKRKSNKHVKSPINRKKVTVIEVVSSKTPCYNLALSACADAVVHPTSKKLLLLLNVQMLY